MTRLPGGVIAAGPANRIHRTPMPLQVACVALQMEGSKLCRFKAEKIIRTGIYPPKMIEGGEALAVLTDLQTVMADTPPPWLAKIFGVSQQDSYETTPVLK
jgi:predicted secreted protein